MSSRLVTLIPETRMALGMTQAQLAQRAHVSLPTVQNIESGRAVNPSLETLAAVFAVLGLEMKVAPREPDWRALIACGAPLTSPGSIGKGVLPRPSPELLLSSLRDSCLFLSREKRPSRERSSVEALLLALRTDYPSFYRKHCARAPLLAATFPERLTGPLIKLKRQASAGLAEYL